MAGAWLGSQATTVTVESSGEGLFDIAVGDDDLFHGDRYKCSLRFTVINLTNQTARTEAVELGFHF